MALNMLARESVSMAKHASPARSARSLQPSTGWVQLERRPPCRCGACMAALRFRLVRWVDPKQLGLALPARRAVVAMSVGWTSHQWLLGESGLRAKDIESLLKVLEAEGVLQTWSVPPSEQAGFRHEALRCVGGSMLQRLKRWWLSPVLGPN